MSLDLVHRLYANQYEISENNRIWNAAGTAVVGYRDGRAETIMDLETPDGAFRHYDGISVGLTKREGRVKVRGSYTYSKQTGTSYSGTSNLYGDIPARDVFTNGYLADDHRHEVKISASVQATEWLSLGTRTTYTSGQPYDRFFRNDETAAYDQLRATRGFNAGSNINDPGDDRALRLPDQLEVNVQTRLNLFPLIGQHLDLYVDVLNALALRTPLSLGTSDGQDFNVQKTWMDPFRIRLGVNYRY